MTTRILNSFGCRRVPVDDIRSLLDLADEYRTALCTLHHERHRAFIDWRNERFPGLFNALVEYERTGAKISELEAEIKRHHSEVQDRNAVRQNDRERLEALRLERKERLAKVRAERKEQSEYLKAFREFWKSLADWKNIKTEAKRDSLYAAIEWPEQFAGYGRLHVSFDTRFRELARAFQARGLHSAIRAEIVEATSPKMKEDGPGTRYEYSRPPRPEAWRKISIHFPGGVTLNDLLAGKIPSLSLCPVEGSRANLLHVVQQAGTKDHPCTLEYDVNVDCEWPDDSRLNRWSLVVTREVVRRSNLSGRRWMQEQLRCTAQPTLVFNDPGKPQGSGAFSYKLSWTRRKDGVQIAEFRGDHVCERLILPNELLECRMGRKHVEAECDIQANAFLGRRGALPPAGKKQGQDALEDWYKQNPSDIDAQELLDSIRWRVIAAQREAKKALRTIEKIYETVAYRVCSRHSSVCAAELDLRNIVRYDTRDLLQDDVTPQKAKEYRFACAVGKLQALLRGYGLASVDVAPEVPPDARDTDLFTTYVQKAAVRKAKKPLAEDASRKTVSRSLS